MVYWRGRWIAQLNVDNLPVPTLVRHNSWSIMINEPHYCGLCGVTTPALFTLTLFSRGKLLHGRYTLKTSARDRQSETSPPSCNTTRQWHCRASNTGPVCQYKQPSRVAHGTTRCPQTKLMRNSIRYSITNMITLVLASYSSDVSSCRSQQMKKEETNK